MKKALLVGIAIGSFVVAGTGVATAGGQNNEKGQEASYTAHHRSQAAVSEKAAKRTALHRHAGRVVDSHLQNEDRFVWEVVIATGASRWEVQVDAGSGAIVSDQADE